MKKINFENFLKKLDQDLQVGLFKKSKNNFILFKEYSYNNKICFKEIINLYKMFLNNEFYVVEY